MVMVNIVPLDREKHADKAWRRPAGYSFASKDAVAPIGGSEFSLAASAMPIGFIQQAGRFIPVAVMGLKTGTNSFLGPIGQWLGHYTPAVFRAYPFYLVRAPGAEQPVLCIDEDSGLIVDPGENTEKFFDTDGAPSAAVNAVLQFLQKTEHDRALADLATASLTDVGVIAHWDLSATIGHETVNVDGLYRVDETKLNGLDDESFCKLRKTSALVIAYAQMLSMGQVSALARLANVQQRMLDVGQGLTQTLTAPPSPIR